MIRIQEITDKKQWETFLSQKEIVYYPLFQSWQWGEVQQSQGFPILRLGIFDGKQLAGVCLVVEIRARRGHYLHLRHGPVLSDPNSIYLTTLLTHIEKLAKEKGASFVRMSPLWEKTEEVQKQFVKQGFLPAPLHNMDAETCWVLDITPSEDTLLKAMRKSHRYLIRKALADKKLRVVKTKDTKEIETFLPLYKDLSERKHFIPHKGVREEFRMFAKDGKSLLFLVFYEDTVIAGGLFTFVGGMAIYRHSASLAAYKGIPAMYLLLWEAIREAKKQGMRRFNFWGIAPPDKPHHPWVGLSLFKMGFGGEKKEFIHAQDKPMSLTYWKSWAIEQITKKMKGY